MFSFSLRNISPTFRCLGGTIRTLTCGPAHSSPQFKNLPLLSPISPSLISPCLINIKKPILDFPLINKKFIEAPNIIIPFLDKALPVIMEEPDKVVEKHAARLIVIRRRKMKKHKLKKLRIKMKYDWAKVRLRRELLKEKKFQAELMGKIKEAEVFDATLYAKEKLNKVNEVLIPKLWKGKRLPEFVIKDLIYKKNQKELKLKQDLERRKKMNLNASDYKL